MYCFVSAYHSSSEPPHVIVGLTLGIMHLAVKLCYKRKQKKQTNPLDKESRDGGNEHVKTLPNSDEDK